MAANGTWIAASVAAATGVAVAATQKGPQKPILAAAPKDPNIDAFRQRNAASQQRGYASAASSLLSGNTAGNFAGSSLIGA